MKRLLFWVFLGYLIYQLLSGEDEIDETVVRPPIPEDVPFNEETGCRSSEKNWRWSSLDGGTYEMSFPVCRELYDRSVRSRENIPYPEYELSDFEYAHYIYLKLLNSVEFPTSELAEGYKKIIEETGMDYMGALNLIISSIQAIPYTLIINENCPFVLNGVRYVNTCAPLESGQGCCGNVQPFGVYSPMEFLYHEAGDCDTRTVFAYSVLNKLGFDAVVINGEEHSMLAVYLPRTPEAGSDYIKDQRGKKYYIWELTGKDWGLGVNPDVNLDYWKIVLP
jgi:hypothetical protein